MIKILNEIQGGKISLWKCPPIFTETGPSSLIIASIGDDDSSMDPIKIYKYYNICVVMMVMVFSPARTETGPFAQRSSTPRQGGQFCRCPFS